MMNDKKNIADVDNHSHDHAHSHLPSDPELRVKAVETLLLNKGLIVSSEIKDIIFLFKKLKVPILENQKIVDK